MGELLFRGLRYAVKEMSPVPMPGLVALRAGAIITADIDNNGVVQLTEIINRL